MEVDLMTAFARVRRAETELATVKKSHAEAEALMRTERAEADNALEVAWQAVEALMAETGEYEVTLPGDNTDYKLSYSTPRETVKVDHDAVPDEFCKIERKPRLKEIGEFLKGLRESGLDFPNWASFEKGTAKLGWRPVKKTAKKEAL